MELAKRIYNGEDITADDTLLRQTAKQLLNGVEKGFNGNILSFNFSSPDFEALAKLTENVYHFSAAKNYHELKDLSLAIRDGNKIRSFEEFEAKAKEITNKYNVSWLRSEYNHAIAASQSAARWNEFSKNKDTMPYLQYQAVMDNNTREDHAALHGVIKPITDPFWDTYMPPNGWGCRCEAVQLPGSNYEPTPNENINVPYVPPLFRTNFGKYGIVFPKSHPYFNGIPQDERKRMDKLSRAANRDYAVVQAIFNFKDFSATIDGRQYEITMNRIGTKHFGQDLIDKNIFFYKNNFLIYTQSLMPNLEYYGEADIDLTHNSGKKTLKLKEKCDKFIYFKTHLKENNKNLYIQCMRFKEDQKIFLYSATTNPPKDYKKK